MALFNELDKILSKVKKTSRIVILLAQILDDLEFRLILFFKNRKTFNCRKYSLLSVLLIIHIYTILEKSRRKSLSINNIFTIVFILLENNCLFPVILHKRGVNIIRIKILLEYAKAIVCIKESYVFSD